MSRYVEKEELEKARQVDLLTYMEQQEPDNLVKLSPNVHRLVEHDSVILSHGLWHQKSTGIGGRSALDYLVEVRRLSLPEAVSLVLSGSYLPASAYIPPQKEVEAFRLPPPNADNKRVCDYLTGRGIDREIVDFAIAEGILYESAIHHNAVFVGRDYGGTPAYAALRGTGNSKFRGEVTGSKKMFSFRIEGISSTLHVFEAAIDLLSYLSLQRIWGRDWTLDSYLSLGGIAAKATILPLALTEFLAHRSSKTVVLHLDNDEMGRQAAAKILKVLPENITGKDSPAPAGKDINDYLRLVREHSKEEKMASGRETPQNRHSVKSGKIGTNRLRRGS